MELLCRDTLSRGFEILELTPSEASPPCPADLMVDMKPLDRWKSWKISRVTGSSVVPVGQGMQLEGWIRGGRDVWQITQILVLANRNIRNGYRVDQREYKDNRGMISICPFLICFSFPCCGSPIHIFGGNGQFPSDGEGQSRLHEGTSTAPSPGVQSLSGVRVPPKKKCTSVIFYYTPTHERIIL